jgi:hypothetical protein
VSLAFTKERHGIKNYSMGFGIDGEKKDYRVAFHAHLYYHSNLKIYY